MWIEIINQAGVGTLGIHSHSVYRDKDLEYGGEAATSSVEAAGSDDFAAQVTADSAATGEWFA